MSLEGLCPIHDAGYIRVDAEDDNRTFSPQDEANPVRCDSSGLLLVIENVGKFAARRDRKRRTDHDSGNATSNEVSNRHHERKSSVWRQNQRLRSPADRVPGDGYLPLYVVFAGGSVPVDTEARLSSGRLCACVLRLPQHESCCSWNNCDYWRRRRIASETRQKNESRH